LAQGNDTGGPVRWPANCTAISALKPTTGRIPSHNVTSFGERLLGVELLATQGPMARSVAVPDWEASARRWATLINTHFHQTSRATMLELGSPDISAMLDAFDVAGAPADLAGIYTCWLRKSPRGVRAEEALGPFIPPPFRPIEGL
jgi:hypothetical protein